MKINKNLISKIFLIIAVILSNNCSVLNLFSPSPYQSVRNVNGKNVLRDSKAEREEFSSIVNSHIKHELAKDHVPGSKEHDWNAFWLNNFKVIKDGSENPEWYVDYIIMARKSAGLPNLRNY